MTSAPITHTAANLPNAIILFAHGSRDPLWRKPIEAVAQQIQMQQPSLPVRCAYLELCEPSLADAVKDLVVTINSIANNVDSFPTNGPKSLQKGILKASSQIRIRIVPMFLGMGKHAREDLPQLAADLRATHPQVDFELAPTVGEDPRLTAMLAQLALG
jgi:sirohydrochlorin cobaltochelatase